MGVENIHLMDVIVALMFDRLVETVRFRSIKHKASSNAFPIYRFPPSNPTWKQDFGKRTVAKVQ